MHPDVIFNESKYSGMEFFGYFVAELQRFLEKNKSIPKPVFVLNFNGDIEASSVENLK